MSGQVVHDENVAGTQMRAQDFFDERRERFFVGGPRVDQRSQDPRHANGRDHGGDRPVLVRNEFDDTLTRRGAAASTSHFRAGAGFIKVNQTSRIEMLKGLLEFGTLPLNVRPQLFSGMLRLFFEAVAAAATPARWS